MEEVKAVKTRQDELYSNENRFYNMIRKEQDLMAREMQEVKKYQINTTLIVANRNEEDKLTKAVEQQHNEMAEIKKQLKDWSLIASAKEAYCCSTHQQANPNLVEMPIKEIPKLMKNNIAKGKHIFHGALKSHHQTRSSSQVAPTPPQPNDEQMTKPDRKVTKEARK
ncbi:hypothetical protein PIB30_039714 [Stylosanthes scabra]|uniref:Uncharacterized protein n=1 Tax=Stylosanthes scabra TaxID=79078 RepID=A0ABU6ZD39_9FABA|nr:hypothetical protein [Stylosanthes scabra]